MAKRKVKLNEDDLKSFLGSALKSSGFLTEDAEIIGFEYKTKAIKRGGDFYKDQADPSDKDPEIVKFIWVFTETKKKRSSKTEAPPDDE